MGIDGGRGGQGGRAGRNLRHAQELLEELQDLQDDIYYVSNMGMCSSKDFLYLHSQSSPHLVFWCGREDNSGAWRWGTARDPRGRNFRNWVVYTCAEVGMGELREAAVTGHGRFVVTTAEGR